MHSDPPGSNCATAPDKVHKAASRREPHDDVKYDQQPPRQSRALGLPEESGACATVLCGVQHGKDVMGVKRVRIGAR